METVTKKKNLYRWNINKDINFLLRTDNQQLFDDSLKTLASLIPKAQKCIRITNALVLRATTLEEITIGVGGSPAVSLEDYITLLDTCKGTANPFNSLSVAVTSIESVLSKIDYDEVPTQYIEHVKLCVRFLKHRARLGSIAVCNMNTPDIFTYTPLEEPTKCIQSKVLKETVYYKERPDEYTRQVYRSHTYFINILSNILVPFHTENEQLAVNCFGPYVYVTAPQKFAWYMQIVGPTVVAALLYPQIIPFISRDKRVSIIDFINNKIALRACGEHFELMDLKCLCEAFQQGGAIRLTRKSVKAYSKFKRSKLTQNQFKRIASTSKNEMVRLLAASYFLPITTIER
jgi:hypothetical protein